MVTPVPSKPITAGTPRSTRKPRSSPLFQDEGLYAIIDVDAWRKCGVDLTAPGAIEAVGAALLSTPSARPVAVQLRAKHEDARSILSLLSRLAVLTKRANVPLIVNDRVDLAILAEADGVHLGQDDLALHDARTLALSTAVGLSTHSLDQLERALVEQPDYVAFGPLFPTQSKERPDPLIASTQWGAAAQREWDSRS
ncbi:MAG: hypothetical protein NVSMB1_11060 [Polyangiales bacterium]